MLVAGQTQHIEKPMNTRDGCIKKFTLQDLDAGPCEVLHIRHQAREYRRDLFDLADRVAGQVEQFF